MVKAQRSVEIAGLLVRRFGGGDRIWLIPNKTAGVNVAGGKAMYYKALRLKSIADQAI